jgi:ribonuclease III
MNASGRVEPDRDDGLESVLGYRFRNPALFRLAFVHRTHSYENPAAAPDDNERLEFLGDAVFSLSVAHSLQGRPERLSEGVMTRIRASLVCERMQADIAREIGLGACLQLGRGEETTGGREKPSNLSNALEALLGAIFLDGGWDAAEASVLRLYGDRIDAAVAVRQKIDAKSRLIEAAQAMVPQRPVSFRISREEGPVHERHFTAEALVDGVVVGSGEGTSKKEAEQAASSSALVALGLI